MTKSIPSCQIDARHQGVEYLNTPRIGNPFRSAILLFIKRTAPAPSLTWLELPKRMHRIWNEMDSIMRYCILEKEMMHHQKNIPAVVLPSFLNTGFNFARSANVVFRIPSSTEIVTGFSSPDFGSTIYFNSMKSVIHNMPLHVCMQTLSAKSTIKFLDYLGCHRDDFIFKFTSGSSSSCLPMRVDLPTYN